MSPRTELVNRVLFRLAIPRVPLPYALEFELHHDTDLSVNLGIFAGSGAGYVQYADALYLGLGGQDVGGLLWGVLVHVDMEPRPP